MGAIVCLARRCVPAWLGIPPSEAGNETLVALEPSADGTHGFDSDVRVAPALPPRLHPKVCPAPNHNIRA
jgi:hypothetical protein